MLKNAQIGLYDPTHRLSVICDPLVYEIECMKILALRETLFFINVYYCIAFIIQNSRNMYPSPTYFCNHLLCSTVRQLLSRYFPLFFNFSTLYHPVLPTFFVQIIVAGQFFYILFFIMTTISTRKERHRSN